MANDKADETSPSVEVLRIAIDEERRFHDELTSAFRSARSKLLYLIAAVLALLTFLYAGAATASGEGTDTLNRLFIPPELYGKIFYFIGLGCILFALGKLLHGARPGANWTVPFGPPEYRALQETDERKYLMALKNEYVVADESNLKTHEVRNAAIKEAFYPLLIGAIILVVLRYFQ